MLLPWLFPQTKRNNFAAKVNSENQEKLLILRKEDASASSGQSELSLVQMGLKQVVASSFWLVFEFQHFKVGCNAARKFPVNGIANAQPQQCGTYRSHNGKLSIAIGHFAGYTSVRTRTSPSLRLRNLTRLFIVTTRVASLLANTFGRDPTLRLTRRRLANQHRRVAPAEYRCVRHPGR